MVQLSQLNTTKGDYCGLELKDQAVVNNMEFRDTMSKLTLEFNVRELENKVDIKELTEAIYADVTQKVDEKDVLGVQIYPVKWPRKVQVMCAHLPAKECLMIQGLDIYGRHIDLHEPGQGIVKVSIEDAPLDISNEKLKAWVSQYGTVVDFRNEFVTINGRRTSWRTGTRHAFMVNISESLPPVVKFTHNDTEVSVNIWHYGQTHMRCRWCHDVVPKSHMCEKKPVRRCFNCGGNDHMRAECKVGRVCYKCGSEDHISRNCRTAPDSRPSTNTAGATFAGSSNKGDSSGVDAVGNMESSARTDTSSSSDVITDPETPEKTDVNVILIGGSNCKNLTFPGDDHFNYNVEVLAQGGLSIGEAHEKLDECGEDILRAADIVVTHVGSCDFPIVDFKQMDENCKQYVELLNNISDKCPNAQIGVCSVLPRVGNAIVNEQVSDFNKRLKALTEHENGELLMYIDNDVHFADESGIAKRKMYEDKDKSGIHINKEGKNRLASSLQGVFKEVCFGIKLQHSWEAVRDS